MRSLLALRALLFVLVLPGIVAGYVPYRLVKGIHHSSRPTVTPSTVVAATMIAAGVVVLLWCVWDFLREGKGTLAPIDPPRRLVVRGPYGFTRNPMYNAVALVLIGEAWLFHSVSVAAYALLICTFFHLFVVLYEEPSLTSRFGESYIAYREAVPRWGFTRKRYRQTPPN